MKYISQRDLENLPDVVKAGTSLGVGGFYTTRDMLRERFLETSKLHELIKKVGRFYTTREFYTTRDMLRERFLETSKLHELIEKYLK